MHGPTTQHSHSGHTHIVAILVANRSGNVLVEKGLLLAAQAAVRELIRPGVRKEFLERHFLPGLEHDDLGATLRELFGHHASGGPRPDHTYVIRCHNFFFMARREYIRTILLK